MRVAADQEVVRAIAVDVESDRRRRIRRQGRDADLLAGTEVVRAHVLERVDGADAEVLAVAEHLRPQLRGHGAAVLPLDGAAVAGQHRDPAEPSAFAVLGGVRLRVVAVVDDHTAAGDLQTPAEDAVAEIRRVALERARPQLSRRVAVQRTHGRRAEHQVRVERRLTDHDLGGAIAQIAQRRGEGNAVDASVEHRPRAIGERVRDHLVLHAFIGVGLLDGHEPVACGIQAQLS